ncbi:hypothetical protein [Leptolyngbya ohadii]|uniref:hypothetical protein n=1 Tax=Leptolyngbya ohadii TaxID=1962290 RepID=UPI000B59CAE3|nr:hypothetical protein [Leptolyngbya ohadii]
MPKDWIGSVEMFTVGISAVCLLTALFTQSVIPAVLGVVPLAVAVFLNGRYRRQIEASRVQTQLRIEQLEQICAEQTAFVNRLASAAPTAPGQEAILMRMRRAMAESYAKTQNRLVALETGELNSLRQDMTVLQADYETIQQRLTALPQLFDRMQKIEQDLYQFQAYLSAFPQQFASIAIGDELQSLKHRLEQMPQGMTNGQSTVDELNSRLIHIEAAIQDLNCRLIHNPQPIQPAEGAAYMPEEVYVLQMLRQKLQEPETVLYPDHGVELPTGMGVQMRFVRLIRRADATSICERLVRDPDLRVPAATVSWVKSRFISGVRELETVIYRNRHGQSDKYLFLYELMKLIDDLIAEFDVVQANQTSEL